MALNLKRQIEDMSCSISVNSKKQRISSNQDCIQQQQDEDENVDKVCVPVLSDEFINEPALVPVYCCDIVDVKKISSIVSFLQQKHPLPNLEHLKRVQSGTGSIPQVIICTVERSLEMGVETTQPIETKQLISDYSESLGLANTVVLKQVPGTPPLTRDQYNYCKKFWPVQFHENKNITKALNGTLFSSEEMILKGTFMSAALNAAWESLQNGQSAVGAVMVDPKVNKVLTVANDKRKLHPIQHAVMVAIDQIAELQGGGIWNANDKELQRPVKTNSKVFDSKSSQTSGPYLCTSYDLYVTREPCTMCAMALVHSRIRCVFYGCTQDGGALGTVYKIHTQQGLNHHFKVFKGPLTKECSQLNEKT